MKMSDYRAGDRLRDRMLDPPDDEPSDDELQAAEQEQDRQGQLAADDAAWDRAHPDRWPE